ncbi:vWA domain-containing protein [Roseomonas gilardii]|nr:von Willebrand factor type A domain-containing protein [Roseomonas gilardii]SUE42943.1 magnesium chelatase subunit D [Roseomonas gilardii subsp. rosea]
MQSSFAPLSGLLVSALLLSACQTAPRMAGAPPAAPAPIAASPAALAVLPERLANAQENGWQRVAEQPISTFSMSSDTASYNLTKRMIREGHKPPPEAVRPEEFVNAFDYAYPAPSDPSQPFTPSIAVYPSPWNEGRQILRIGLRTYAPPRQARPALNLVFLVDVSGSMAGPDRLDLIKRGLRLLLPRLRAEDRISLVTYANGTQTVLDSVPGDRLAKIEAAIDGLSAAGGTAGGAGLNMAYDLAAKNRKPGAVNRVVLATDGDFNIGPSSVAELTELIAARRRSGIYLTTIGVGLGNINDRLLNTLARTGNGIALYAGDLEDLSRGLVEDFTTNTVPVADDVKLQVEFNPVQVTEYRLVGYETRPLRQEDFGNDRVDAGEVGSGKAVTALYEFVQVGSAAHAIPVRRYAAQVPSPASGDLSREFAHLRIAYKLPGQERSRLIERSIMPEDAHRRFEEAPEDARFATAVAGFAQVLRRSGQVDADLPRIARMAEQARGPDPDGRRAELISLIWLSAGGRR